nr:hypothetical protein [Tanacetum cinerariifolium]
MGRPHIDNSASRQRGQVCAPLSGVKGYIFNCGVILAFIGVCFDSSLRLCMTYVLMSVALAPYQGEDYTGMEGDGSLAIDFMSSLEAYQGIFVVLTRDLDVTLRTQGAIVHLGPRPKCYNACSRAGNMVSMG